MKNYIKHICLVIFVTITFSLQAQELFTLNDIYYDRSNVNTAFIVADNAPLNASLTTSLGGGVQDTRRVNLLAYGDFKKLDFGVGLKLNTAFYGLFNFTTAEVLYAKDFQIDDNQTFYLGTNFGLHHVRVVDKLLNEYVEEDPLLGDNEFPQYRFTVGAGIGYHHKNLFRQDDIARLGFSIPALLKNKDDFRPDFFMNVMYGVGVHSDVRLDQEIMMYGTITRGLTGEYNIKATYLDAFSLRLGVRTTGSLLFGMGWKRQVMEIGYIYQANTSEYNTVIPGVHNVNVSYSF